MFDIINEVGQAFDYEKDIESVLLKLTEEFDLNSSIFNVIIVTDEKIKEINKEYRNKDKVTDVISFALNDTKDIEMPIKMLGDVYISFDRAKVQAIEYKHSLKRELAFLTVHGMLHLLGYDHMNDEDEKAMFLKQEEILNELGINRGEI